MSGATPTAAAAEALAYLTGLTQVLGASLLSARPESDSVFLDGVASITVHLALTTNAEGIRKLLEYVETGPKLFRVRSLAVTQPAPAAAAPLDEALRVDLSVESVARRVGDGESR